MNKKPDNGNTELRDVIAFLVMAILLLCVMWFLGEQGYELSGVGL